MPDNESNTTVKMGVLAVLTALTYAIGRRRGYRRTVKQLKKLNHQ